MTEWLRKLYQKLWRKVGGRLWTEIIRDDQRRPPLLFLLIFLRLGSVAGKPGGKYWWQILLGLLMGILAGHFWW